MVVIERRLISITTLLQTTSHPGQGFDDQVVVMSLVNKAAVQKVQMIWALALSFGGG